VEKKFYFKIGIIIIALVLLGAATLFLTQERPLDNTDVSLLESDPGIEFVNGEWIELIPTGGYTAGIIFYQGGNVAAEAYVPLLRPLAEQGFLVIIPKAPLALSFFSTNNALGVMLAYNTTLDWTLMGHSLGGVAATIYANNYPDIVDRLVLLGSYPSVDISDTDIDVLSLSAENDLLTTQDEIEDTKSLLPVDTQYEVISGGNHAYFGDYGSQDGDGIATITRIDQQQEVRDVFLDFYGLHEADTTTEVEEVLGQSFFFPLRDIDNDLSGRHYFNLIMINLIFSVIPLAVLIQTSKIYITTKNFRKEIAPILTIALFMLVSRLLPALNRIIGLQSSGTREFVINEIQANILPFVFIFNAFASMLLFYVRVPSKRKGRFNWTIRLARFSAITTGVSILGFLSLGIIQGSSLSSDIFTYYAYTLFLLIVVLLIVVYRILSTEQKASTVKLTRMKLALLRLLVLFTVFYLISAVVLTFAILFGGQDIDFFTSAIFITLYSCLISSVGSILSYWVVNSPEWLKKRYGMAMPISLDM
jgi:hypothetical protein